MISLNPRLAFGIYELGWRAVQPVLRFNPRLEQGYERRTLKDCRLPRADLWIQAASAGEAYLAATLLEELTLDTPLDVLVTTNTRQGMEILERTRDLFENRHSDWRMWTSFLPFDRPSLMQRAVAAVRPQVMVLLESEIWPALMASLRRFGAQIYIINGRLSEKSLKRYRLWPGFWRALGPDRVLAISGDDARRFGILFGPSRVATIPNMKFDRFSPAEPADGDSHPIAALLAPQTPFIVLGSVRQPEESDIRHIICRLRATAPEAVIGLYPRHMERLPYWQSVLTDLGAPWMYRSSAAGKIPAGTTLLGDVFGELSQAYGRAQAAFVGGSLTPLGGQNFLEALVNGVIPVSGPSWHNFAWVGEDIVKQGLLQVADTWYAVAERLLATLRDNRPREEIRRAGLDFVRQRQGGTRSACEFLRGALARNGTGFSPGITGREGISI